MRGACSCSGSPWISANTLRCCECIGVSADTCSSKCRGGIILWWEWAPKKSRRCCCQGRISTSQSLQVHLTSCVPCEWVDCSSGAARSWWACSRHTRMNSRLLQVFSDIQAIWTHLRRHRHREVLRHAHVLHVTTSDTLRGPTHNQKGTRTHAHNRSKVIIKTTITMYPHVTLVVIVICSHCEANRGQFCLVESV